MKRAIITGATGAIGTALVQELVNNNIKVLVICRKGSERNKNILKHPLVQVLECSLEDLKHIKNDDKEIYDVFYHFAWKGTSGNARNDMRMQNENVKYTLDAIEVAKKFGCRVFIGAGSQAEYGRTEGRLQPETPTFPENGYGIAKLCAGLMSKEYAHQMGLKHIWVRVLSVYGPCDGEQSMIMSTIRKLEANMTPQFTKGEQMWDYLYSEDAARAFRMLGEKGIDGKVYVLGSGKVKRLYEYIEKLRDIVKKDAKIELGAVPYAEKQVMYLCADISELTKDIGFVPKYTFEEGITKTKRWCECNCRPD